MDWTELNSDILRLFAKKLGDISNFIRFRAVCKNWRSAVQPCDHPPQLPWFIQSDSWRNDSSYIKMFSLHSNKTHNLYVPQAKKKKVLGPSSRYILVNDFQRTSLSLLNPFTGTHLRVPRIHHIDSLAVFCLVSIGPNYNPNSCPAKNSDIVIIYSIIEGREREGDVEEEEEEEEEIVRVEDEKMEEAEEGEVQEEDDQEITLLVEEENVEEDDEEGEEISFVNFLRLENSQLTRTKTIEMSLLAGPIAYHKERLFVHMFDGQGTRVFDVITGDVAFIIPEQDFHLNCLIEAFGDLLGVATKSCGKPDVYRLEDSGTNPHWVEMTDGIGERMLFLYDYGGLCLKASDFDGFEGNCIYTKKLNYKDGNGHGHVLYRYDLTNDEKLELPFSGDFLGTWFVPSLY